MVAGGSEAAVCRLGVADLQQQEPYLLISMTSLKKLLGLGIREEMVLLWVKGQVW